MTAVVTSYCRLVLTISVAQPMTLFHLANYIIRFQLFIVNADFVDCRDNIPKRAGLYEISTGFFGNGYIKILYIFFEM